MIDYIFINWYSGLEPSTILFLVLHTINSWVVMPRSFRDWEVTAAFFRFQEGSRVMAAHVGALVFVRTRDYWLIFFDWCQYSSWFGHWDPRISINVWGSKAARWFPVVARCGIIGGLNQNLSDTAHEKHFPVMLIPSATIPKRRSIVRIFEALIAV